VALTIFLVALILVLYVIFGYPLVLGLLSRLRSAEPVRGGWQPQTVSVLLAVRNGERWIRHKLESILALDHPRDLLQVLVLDDGSTDRTREIAAEYQARGVQVVPLPACGKAAALGAGIERATGEILFFTDVRQRLDRDALRYLTEDLSDPAIGVASGELVILDGDTQQEADIGLYWRYEKWIRKRLSRLGSVMGATGSIYAMRRSLASPIPPDMLVDDMFLPISAFFRGYRVVFDERAKAFDYPTALGQEFRRKVRTLAGNYQIIRRFPGLLLPTHRMWVHFVSHKLGRLMLPFALLAMAFATPFLPAGLRATAAVGQLGLYGLAALDCVLPEGTRLKRLSSPARTFVVLVAAAFVAASILLPGRRDLWKPTGVDTPADPSPSSAIPH
jgi:cellulose synthase/poly-beta-1,6-N-acetylglucosamine synthase-like glycosyltransferase